MTVCSSYSVYLKGIYSELFDTVHIYRDAVAFLIDVVDKHWDDIKSIKKAKERKTYVEQLVHNTDDNVAIYKFDEKFPHFPSYLRRSAISAAIGSVSSYRSNYDNWVKGGSKGRPPKLTHKTGKMPVFYKGNMYKEENGHSFIKLYNKKTKSWYWRKIFFRKQDLKYLDTYWAGVDASAPVLRMKHGKAYLVFSFKNKVDLTDFKEIAIGVDLGINTDAALCAMYEDGTVLARKFVNFESEKARILHLMHIASKVQRKSGPGSAKNIWSYIQLLNKLLADKIAKAIVEFAVQQSADVIVFEHLDMKGHKTKSQKIAMWRKNDIQDRVLLKAHRLGMRVSRICAWNTSKLAYDGSGKVVRDKNNYSLCTFATGKRYNCDLSACYNIAARFFLRELAKTFSTDQKSYIEANVPGCMVRTKQTLSTLISLYAVLSGSPASV